MVRGSEPRMVVQEVNVLRSEMNLFVTMGKGGKGCVRRTISYIIHVSDSRNGGKEEWRFQQDEQSQRMLGTHWNESWSPHTISCSQRLSGSYPSLNNFSTASSAIPDLCCGAISKFGFNRSSSARLEGSLDATE